MDSKIIGTSLASLAMVVASGGAAWSMMTSSPDQSTAAADIITYVTEAAPALPSNPVTATVAPAVIATPVAAAPAVTQRLAPAPAQTPALAPALAPAPAPAPVVAAATPVQRTNTAEPSDSGANTEADD